MFLVKIVSNIAFQTTKQKAKMDKSKKKYDAKRALAIKSIAERYAVTEQYVRNIDNNPNLTGGQTEEIRSAYRKKYAQLHQVLS